MSVSRRLSSTTRRDKAHESTTLKCRCLRVHCMAALSGLVYRQAANPADIGSSTLSATGVWLRLPLSSRFFSTRYITEEAGAQRESELMASKRIQKTPTCLPNLPARLAQ